MICRRRRPPHKTRRQGPKLRIVKLYKNQNQRYQPSISANEIQQDTMKLVETEKTSNEAKSDEKSAGEKIPISGTNKIQQSNSKAPASSNDQVTSEKTQQTLQESAEGYESIVGFGIQTSGYGSKCRQRETFVVDTSLSSQPAKKPAAGSMSIPSTGLKDSVVVSQSQSGMKSAPAQPPAPPSDTIAPTTQSQPPTKPSAAFPLPVPPQLATTPNPAPSTNATNGDSRIRSFT